MDEADLLGEVDGDAEASRLISQEEEDALLNGDFEPTTSTAAAATDAAAPQVTAAAAALVPVIDPPAANVDPPPEKAEDELMNDDSESSKSSEERRERSQDMPASSNASETDEFDPMAHSATAENIRNSSYMRSMLREAVDRLEKNNERYREKMDKKAERIKEETETRLRQVDQFVEEQKKISKRLQELNERLAQLDPLPARQQEPVEQQIALPNSMMRRSAPMPAGAQRMQQLQQLQQHRRHQRASDDDAVPSTSRAIARRVSTETVVASRGVMAMERRMHTVDVGPGPSNGASGPSRAVVQPQQLAIANAQHAIAAASATAAARMLGAATTPAHQAVQSRQLQHRMSNRISPHANQATSSPGVAPSRSVPQQLQPAMNIPSSQRPAPWRSERQTATIAPQSQQAAAISAALAAGDAASGSRPAVASPSLQQLQQMSRKRPHTAGDGHPGHQQTRNGQQLPPLQHVQPQRQMPPQPQQPGVIRAQQPQQQQQRALQRPPPSFSPDADPELRELSEYITGCFQRKLPENVQQLHSRVYSQLHAACRLEVQIRDMSKASHPLLSMAFRLKDASFVVPPEGSAPRSKISVEVPEWNLIRPHTRPNSELPMDAVKGDHSPRVQIVSDYRDFTASGKLNGKVIFTPTPDWPESTARVCIFFYIATQNLQKWTQSEFATADFKEREENGNFKEASVKFVISLDKAKYFAKDERGAMNPNIKFESFVIVPVVCAGSGSSARVVRGKEVAFDCEALEQNEIRRKYDSLMVHMRQFREHEQKMAARPPQPPPIRPVRPARPPGADDDIIEL